MVALDSKFSTFANGGDLEIDDVVVGLRNGINTKFSFQGTPGIYLPLAGGTMSGAIDMNSNSITDLPLPVSNFDAANKFYVDSRTGAVGATGTILRSNGTNWVASTSTFSDTYPANNILYASSANTVAGLSPVASGLMVTSAGAVPSFSTDIPTAVTIGTAYIYRVGGTDVSVSDGGTGNSSATAYAVLCGGTTSTNPFQSVSGVGTLNQVLISQGAGALPIWGSVPGVVPAALTKVDDTNVTLTLGGTPTTALLQATSITVGWSGQLAATRGGTGIGTYTLGDTLYSSAANTLSKLAGNITTVKQYLSQTGTGVVSAAPSWETISGGDITGAALTKVDDTNVTLTLGGSPSTALLRATSLTLGWSGLLSLARGGTNANLTASNGGIFYSTATEGAILAGTATANKMLLSGATAAPTWSTSTIPSSAGATANKVLLSDGTNYVLSTPTFPNASATSGKIIISDGTNWIASTPTFPNAATGTGTILRADGTNWVATTATYPTTTTINQLLYSSANNVIGGITAGNNGVLISGTTGIPSWLAAGTTGQVLVATTSNPASWATLSGIAVTAISGTSNQIAASASVGSVTLSLTNGISLGTYQAIASPSGGIIASGSVGIGISSPASKFHVFDSSTSPATDLGSIILSGTAGTGTPRLMFGINYAAGVMNYSWIQSVASGSANKPLFLQPNSVGTGTGVSIGSTTSPGSILDIGANLSVGSSYVGIAAPTNGAIIQGNTGIGTSSVATKFHVFDSSTTPVSEVGSILLSGTITSGPPAGIPRLCMGISYSAGSMSYAWIQAVETGRAARPLILQGIGTDAGVTICSTTSPGSKLDINGNLTVGSSYVGVAAPTNGAIIQGQTSIGTSSASGTLNLAWIASNSSNRLLNVSSTVSPTLSSFTTQYMVQVDPIFSPNSGSSDLTSYYASILCGPNIRIPSGQTWSGIFTNLYLSVDFTSNAGSISNGFNAIYYDGGGSWVGAGTLATNRGGYFAKPLATATVRQALFAYNLAVGYDTQHLADTKNLVVEGKTGLSTSSPSYGLDVGTNSNNQADLYLIRSTGSRIGASGSAMGAILVDNTMAPTFSGTVSNTRHIYINPTVTPGSGCTITSAAGLTIGAGTSGGAGTTTYGYGISVDAPAFGATAKIAAYLANFSVGYATVTPPTSGGIMSGSFGIGTSSVNSSAVLHLESTSKGFLMPLNTQPHSNISSPTDGLMTYNNASYWKIPQFYNGSKWLGLAGYSLLSALSFSNVASIGYADSNELPLNQFQTWLVLFENLLPVTDSATFEFQITTDGGSTYVTTGYSGGVTSNTTSSSATWANVNSTSYVTCGALRNTSPAWGFIYLGNRNFTDTTYWGVFSQLGAQGLVNSYNATANANGFRILFSSGNISTVTVVIYGLHGSQGS